MGRTAQVIRHELRTVFGGKAFLFFAFVFPTLALLILGGINLVQGRLADESTETAPEQDALDLHLEGYVDVSGLIREIPEDLPAGVLTAFESEAEARGAVERGEITAYYLIPEDYLDRGEVFYILPNQGSFLDAEQSWILERILVTNLLAGNQNLAEQASAPVLSVQSTSIAPQFGGEAAAGNDCTRPGSACESNTFVAYIPSLLVIVFFIAIISSSSMLFNSVTKEKENRTIEVLLVSINSRQLLAGKTIALGIAGLTQTAVWLASIYLALNVGGSTMSLPADFSFPPQILAWSLVFFIGGFALYASLMAGAGALVPRMRESGTASFIVMTPLLFGYLVALLAVAAESTTGLLTILLSFIPLTSPVVMVMRLTDGFVPAWQTLVSAALLFAGAYLTFRSVAAMFHAQNLLSGQSYSLKKYLQALVGRA
ncbi:MAG TPA: ABC transporter permease [Anaerolineales bacterium]|nr:ABC transporter permease [Anaerolineales bacterium]